MLALWAAACERGPASLPEPQYGIDRCAHCARVIGDPRPSAQYRTAAGEVKSFDDPACLFEALRAESDPPSAIRFHAHDADQWLAPAQVWFARPATPPESGSGWVVYPSFAAAQDAVTSAGGGMLMSFDEAKVRLQRTDDR